MRAGTADAYAAHVKTKTCEAKLVRATAAGIAASAEGDAEPKSIRGALPMRGRAPYTNFLATVISVVAARMPRPSA